MKRTIIAVAVSASVVVLSGYSQADSLSHWKTQDRFNNHIQGQTNDQQSQLNHLERSENNQNKWLDRIQTSVDNNTAWNDRQEGVIRQNRGRLDDNDAMNQRQNDSIDNAHARIGVVKDQADNDRVRINGNEARSIGNQKQLGVTDKRSINNAERLDGAEGAIRETNAQQTVDRTASFARDNRIESESVHRDDDLAGRIGTVDADSRGRDAELAAYSEQTRQMHQSMADYNNAQWTRQMGVDSVQDSRLDKHDREISGLKDDVRQIKSGIAGVAALNAVFDPNYDGLQSHVGTAVYDSGSAIGVSLGGKVSRNNFIHAGASLPNRGSSVFQAGITTRW